MFITVFHLKNAFKRALNFVFEVEFFMHNWHFQTQNRFWFNLTKNRHIFSLMAPKDGLEQPTTGEDPVEEDIAISNYDESNPKNLSPGR